MMLNAETDSSVHRTILQPSDKDKQQGRGVVDATLNEIKFMCAVIWSAVPECGLQISNGNGI